MTALVNVIAVLHQYGISKNLFLLALTQIHKHQLKELLKAKFTNKKKPEAAYYVDLHEFKTRIS